MVLKRKLPSRLIQSSQEEERAEAVASPDVFEDNIETETQAPKTEEPTADLKSQDVYSEIPEPSKPASSSMKRKVKNRRQRGEGIAKMKEQVLASKNTTDKDGVKNPEEVDFAPVAPRPDAEETLATTMADLKGEIKNPEEEEIEAAYISPAIASKPEGTPDFDLSSSAKNKEEAPVKDEFPEPTPIDSTSAEPAKVENITAPESFAEIEPKIEEPKAEPIPELPTPPSLAEENKSAPSSNWDFGEFASGVPETTASENQTPPIAPEIGDPYKDVGENTPPELPTSQAPELPPELPSSKTASIANTLRAPSGGLVKLFVLIVAVLLIVVMVVVVRSGDKTRKGIKKFNDSYADVKKDIPILPKDEVQKLEFEMDDAMAKLQMASLPPKETAKKLGIDPSKLVSAPIKKSNTKVDFVDVSAKEAEKPVTVNNADMPEDIGAIARLQREITRLKAGKNPTKNSGTSKEDDLVMSKQALDSELSAYRKALMQADGINKPVPKPGEFRAENNFPKANLQEVTGDGKNGLPPSKRYLENPYELPVIAEPEGASTPQIRTLNDFELALTAPEKEHVRIPKGIRPRMSATDFPEIEVLSFIPDKGIIATNKGMEGVLLIGEVIEGWELVSVYKGYAEFRNGKRKRVVTWD